MLWIAHRTRAPLDHFAHYCAKPCRDETDPTPLARLVWYKAKSIGDDFTMLCDQDWPELTYEFPNYDDVGRRVANKLTLRNHADYDTRILKQVNECPLSLLNFAKEPPDRCCKDRQELCDKLLACEARNDGHDAYHALGPAAMKLISVFRNDLHECV